MAARLPLLATLFLALASLVSAHVSVNPSSAVRGSNAVLAMRPTAAVEIQRVASVQVVIPFNVTSVKPRRVAGWTVSMLYRPLSPPTTDSHGNVVNTTVDAVVWTANTPQDYLPDSFFEDFQIQAKLPSSAAGDVLYFPTTQNCSNGEQAFWTDTTNSGKTEPAPKLTLNDTLSSTVNTRSTVPSSATLSTPRGLAWGVAVVSAVVASMAL